MPKTEYFFQRLALTFSVSQIWYVLETEVFASSLPRSVPILVYSMCVGII